MRYLVFSDLHGSSYYAQKIKEFMGKYSPDKLVLLGDLYYHGPRNSLPYEYSPMSASEVLNEFCDKIICIKGNCDAEVDEMLSKFSFSEHVDVLINNKKIRFTHGHKENIDAFPSDIDVLIYGHFHTGFIKKLNDKIYINSGSITLPKNGTSHSFLLIEDNVVTLLDEFENVIDKIEL